MRIIPEELNKKIKKEYKLRFFTLLFIYMSIALLVVATLMSSSYVLVYLYEKAYVKKGFLGNKETVVLHEQVDKKIDQLYQLSRKITLEDNVPKPIVISKILFDYAGDSIQIQSIEVSSDSKVTLRAIANTRESLINFQNKINTNPVFKDFSIPIESLAKQKDVNFNVTFTYYEN